jgi:hypothetical protein
LWYDTPDNAIGYAMHDSPSHDAVIRVYDDAGNVTDTHEHAGEFKEWKSGPKMKSDRVKIPPAFTAHGAV